MITTRNYPEPYRTAFSSAEHSAVADAPRDKGGDGTGFGPHELLEAALATCLNMAVRMEATRLGIPIGTVQTRVALDRTQTSTATFKYMVEIEGNINAEHRRILDEAAAQCPVRSTLARALVFRCESAK